METKNSKVGLIAVEIPWNNSESLGIFDSLEEANAAAQDHIANFAELFDEKSIYQGPEKVGEEGYGRTVDESGEENEEGYDYLFLACDGPCVYVAKEPYLTGDETTLHGPYKDLAEANAKVLRKVKTKFAIVAGSFSYGTYPIDTGRTRYTAYFIY